jgi:hypothetical protein
MCGATVGAAVVGPATPPALEPAPGVVASAAAGVVGEGGTEWCARRVTPGAGGGAALAGVAADGAGPVTTGRGGPAGPADTDGLIPGRRAANPAAAAASTTTAPTAPTTSSRRRKRRRGGSGRTMTLVGSSSMIAFVEPASPVVVAGQV